MSANPTHAALLSPGAIGPMQLRNRIVMPAMDQNLCDADGMLTEANLDHYEQRAAGGAGLLILETSAVAYPVGATSRHQPALSTDACIPGLTALADRVHAHGAKVIVQACHHGRVAGIDVLEERPQLVPTAPVPPFDAGRFIDGLTIDEMIRLGERIGNKTPTFTQATDDDLAWAIDQFAQAADRIARAGCDGIEIHGAHGYLIASFLSPYFNQRNDAWGGDLDRRTRLLREVTSAVKSAVPSDFAVIVRLDGKEFGVEGGITLDLAVEHAAAAIASGADGIHVSAYGAPDDGVAFTDGPLPWQPSHYQELSSTIAARSEVPVIAVGRILPDAGDAMIASGEVDFVAMGRQLLADPDLPRRLTEGRADLVRPCINCYVCVAQNFWDGAPVCAVNARLGRGLDAPSPSAHPKRVVVVGAGPGGLEAARIAAQRGHHVTLVDKAKHLGGTARFSSLTTPMNGELVQWFTAAVSDLDIDVQLETTATADSIAALQPDAVIIATGAVRTVPDVPGGDADHVLSGDDLRALLTGDDPGGAARKLSAAQRLAVRAGRSIGVTNDMDRLRQLSKRWMPVGDNVVVWGGGLVGVELAEFLAERGRSVTVIEPGDALGVEMAHPRRWRALHEAREHGVRFITGATVDEITDDTVVISVGETSESLAADHVVVATGVNPDHSLADAVAAALPAIEVHTIGDADSIGYIEGAIRAGFDVGSTV